MPDVLRGSSDATLHGVRDALGLSPDYVHRFFALNEAVAVAELDAVAAIGGTPLITIEPWEPDDGVHQPGFTLRRIASGDFDDQLRRWGRDLGRWRKPVLLRFAHEMNGSWYPWSIGVNSNTAEDFKDAWRRMWGIISASAPNVEFVWAPNAVTAGIGDFEQMYPGADTVDYLGLDGYNWGDGSGAAWMSPDELFDDSVNRLNELAGDRPILITEVASAEDNRDPDRKAKWITDFIGSATKWLDVAGFVWFQTTKERDWRFTSSPTARDAFRTSLSTTPDNPQG